MSVSSKGDSAKSRRPFAPEETTSPRLLDTVMVDAHQVARVNNDGDAWESNSDASSADETSNKEQAEKKGHLPGEMWLEILSYLPKKDLKTARLVKAAFAEFVSTHTDIHGTSD